MAAAASSQGASGAHPVAAGQRRPGGAHCAEERAGPAGSGASSGDWKRGPRPGKPRASERASRRPRLHCLQGKCTSADPLPDAAASASLPEAALKPIPEPRSRKAIGCRRPAHFGGLAAASPVRRRCLSVCGEAKGSGLRGRRDGVRGQRQAGSLSLSRARPPLIHRPPPQTRRTKGAWKRTWGACEQGAVAREGGPPAPLPPVARELSPAAALETARLT